MTYFAAPAYAWLLMLVMEWADRLLDRAAQRRLDAAR